MIFKKIILMMMIFCAFQVMTMQNQQDLFMQGKELFMQGHYQEAFDTYQQIENKNFVVLYNMAVSCLKLHQKLQVLLLAKRAEKQASTYKEFTLIEELLKFDEDKESFDENWYEQFLNFLQKIILIIPMIIVQLLVLIGLLMMIIGLNYQWYRRREKISILILFIWLVLYYICSYKINFMQQQYGVILKNNTAVLSGPDSSFYKKLDLDELVLVRIVDHCKQYCKIVSLDGLVGWVAHCDIEMVE